MRSTRDQRDQARIEKDCRSGRCRICDSISGSIVNPLGNQSGTSRGVPLRSLSELRNNLVRSQALTASRSSYVYEQESNRLQSDRLQTRQGASSDSDRQSGQITRAELAETNNRTTRVQCGRSKTSVTSLLDAPPQSKRTFRNRASCD